jgi:hypothetical protein
MRGAREKVFKATLDFVDRHLDPAGHCPGIRGERLDGALLNRRELDVDFE